MNKTLLICLLSTFLLAEKVTYQNGYNNDNMNSNGEILFLTSTIRNLENPVIFDVGANVGKWTNAVLRVNPTATIHAFEPNPHSFSKLLQCGHNRPNIQCYMIGFSKEERPECIFYTYRNIKEWCSVLDGLYNRPALKALLKGSPEEIHVEISTLDTFCKDQSITEIDLLKIDTEGEEFNVLLGGMDTLDNCNVKAIQFEYGGCFVDSNTKLEDIYILLTSKGYSIFRLLPRGKKHIEHWDSSLENYQHSNYVAIKDK